MAAAHHRILIIGWDFDARILLEPTERFGETLGEFFLALARKNPKRRIDIHKWGFGAKKQFLRPRAVWILWQWARTKAIEFRFDNAHPPGCSHHQKIVVLDDRLAVCGGIDISTGRWDTPAHIDDDQNRRLRSEEHTSELQSLMRNSYAVFCLKKKLTHPSIYSKRPATSHPSLRRQV